MGWEGEIGAGAAFLVVGVLQGYSVVKAYRSESPGRARLSSKGAIRLVELSLIALFAILHMVVNIFTSRASKHQGLIVGPTVSLERSGVAAVFLLYAMVGLVTETTAVLPLPWGTLELIASFAFGVEFLLFYLPSTGQAGLEGQYHYLMLVPIGACLLSTASEIVYPLAHLPPLARSMALIFQGTWFFQMGISIFTTRWMAQGCQLDDKGGGDYTVSCEDMKQLMKGKALATLQFNSHLALLLLCLLPLYSLMSKIYKQPANYVWLDDKEGIEDEIGLFGDKGRTQELAQANYFHVLEDDEEDSVFQPKTLGSDSNGFHSVSI